MGGLALWAVAQKAWGSLALLSLRSAPCVAGDGGIYVSIVRMSKYHTFFVVFGALLVGRFCFL